MLDKRYHAPIYAIYGFVRYADEIVDTFHEYDKAALLARFKRDTYQAIAETISLNPVLHSFQRVVHEFNIDHELIDAFLHSMAMDLHTKEYNADGYGEYIYGSAEVVGLMCLRVFCEGDRAEFDRLRAPARKLGSAFQKVNFLRDLSSDYIERGRTYFPGVDFAQFDDEAKMRIEADVQHDFDAACVGIVNLPRGARMGVYLAYAYYQMLFNKIRQLPASIMQSERIRVPNQKKLVLLAQTYLKHRFNVFQEYSSPSSVRQGMGTH